MNRRGFLGGLLVAPAVVRAESLTKLWAPPERVVVWKSAQPGLSYILAKEEQGVHLSPSGLFFPLTADGYRLSVQQWARYYSTLPPEALRIAYA